MVDRLDVDLLADQWLFDRKRHLFLRSRRARFLGHVLRIDAHVQREDGLHGVERGDGREFHPEAVVLRQFGIGHRIIDGAGGCVEGGGGAEGRHDGAAVGVEAVHHEQVVLLPDHVVNFQIVAADERVGVAGDDGLVDDAIDHARFHNVVHALEALRDPAGVDVLAHPAAGEIVEVGFEFVLRHAGQGVTERALLLESPHGSGEGFENVVLVGPGVLRHRLDPRFPEEAGRRHRRVEAHPEQRAEVLEEILPPPLDDLRVLRPGLRPHREGVPLVPEPGGGGAGIR